jgi:Transposase DDE domain group 1
MTVTTPTSDPFEEALSVTAVSHAPDRLGATFDDEGLVANAGLLVVATLSARLGIGRIVNATVRMAGLVGGAHPGRKVLTLVHAIVAGASHIDHADVLRAGDSERVLGHRVMAPSTLGTFLRAFSFGHVRQLEAVVGRVLARAWELGAGPADGRLVVDVDSTICEVHGYKKQGAAYGYTKVVGYHPIVAVRADSGEVLHARMRKGSANTARGARRFIDELVARLRRAGAGGEIVMRFDAGFWSNDTINVLARHGVRYTMAVRANNKYVAAVIAAIDENAWVETDYTPGGQAQVAETTYNGRRLIVRRTRLTGQRQARLWPDWRHFAFLTDLPGPPVEVDAFHRAHASVELAIRDLKEGAGLEHCPSGNFSANSAWLQCAVLAHNLIRWTATIGESIDTLTVARSVRTQLIALPARIVNRSGIMTLRMPARWPWADQFSKRLTAIRALPAPTG